MQESLITASIENDLRLDIQQQCGKLDWLENSYIAPGDFWRSIKTAYDTRFSTHGSSSLFSRYNFYHDIVIRNRNNMADAFCWYDNVSGFRSFSYKEIGSAAETKSDLWSIKGIKPGQTVCIIRHAGLEMAVEMLAGLKTGCIISFLPPVGKGFLERRLEALKPDHISIDETHIPLIPEWKGLAITEHHEGIRNIHNESRLSFTYQSGQTVFCCFNPCGQEPLVPVGITSDAAYLCALRDGIIALGLGPGQIYAAPGFNQMEVFPFLLLTGLLCGSTYLHLTAKDISANPEIVTRKKIKVFGVSRKVRDILLQAPVDASASWESWFRNPAESRDIEQWHNLIKTLRLGSAFAFNLRWDASMGGCSLFSVRRKGTAHMSVMPVPGCSWCLGSLPGGGESTLSGIGKYTISAPCPPEEEKMMETSDIISRNRHEYFFVGMDNPDRDGRNYPVDEILFSLKNMEKRYEMYFSMTEVPTVDSGRGHRFVLLVFSGANMTIDRVRLTDEIRMNINQEMGDDFQPDKIEFLPVYPRFLSVGQIDHAWCRSRFLTGDLTKRSKLEFFRCITRLRQCLLKMENDFCSGA